MAASGLAVSLRLTGGRRRRPPWQGRKYRFGTSEHESVRAILSPGGWATLGRQRERPPVRQVPKSGVSVTLTTSLRWLGDSTPFDEGGSPASALLPEVDGDDRVLHVCGQSNSLQILD
jgi:hypothetical protein